MRNTPDEQGYSFSDHWKMVVQITRPLHQDKQFTALNWGRNLTKIAGDPSKPKNAWNKCLNATMHRPTVSWQFERETYLNSQALLHFYPHQEAFSFAVAKAMLLGTVPVVAPSPAHLSLVRHEETGFFVRSPDEAAYYASKLAWEPLLRLQLATKAYSWFVTEGPGNPDKCLKWWKEGGICG
jgi:hypothetical protein